MRGFTVGGPTNTSMALVDVTCPMARVPTNGKQAKKLNDELEERGQQQNLKIQSSSKKNQNA